MRGGSSLRHGSSSASSPSRSRRARRRPRSCSSAASASTRRCSRTSTRRHRPCTSTSSASGPATSANGSPRRWSPRPVPESRSGSSSTSRARNPTTRHASCTSGFRQPGCRSWSRARRRCGLLKVCSVLPAGPRAGIFRAWAHRLPQGRRRRRADRVVGGADRRGPLRRRAVPRPLRQLEGAVVGQLQLVFIASFRWLGGTIPGAAVDELFPTIRRPRATCPLSSCTTLLAATAPSQMRSPS